MLWGCLFSVGLASVEMEAPPRVGAPTVVIVTDEADRPRPGETVRVIHRPGLAGTFEQAIGITDGRGRVRWTPSHHGLAEVRAGAQGVRMSITPEAPPLGAWGSVAALALLFVGSVAGAVWRARRP